MILDSQIEIRIFLRFNAVNILLTKQTLTKRCKACYFMNSTYQTNRMPSATKARQNSIDYVSLVGSHHRNHHSHCLYFITYNYTIFTSGSIYAVCKYIRKGNKSNMGDFWDSRPQIWWKLVIDAFSLLSTELLSIRLRLT
ncbi:Hypothetical_protein [Hexamita inflata]|uniref:Hypothetical_protein n=1 Tax=Hexamita inflata TaxID=28002 RepID=A0AA86U5Y7_9EUKA|nr:Hypothetical protein HINF_LOCUS29909 [Hexamita inflata]